MKVELEKIYEFLTSYKGLPFPIHMKDWLTYKKEQWGNRFDLVSGKESFASLYGKPVVMPVTIGGIKLGSGEEGHINLQPLVVFEGSKIIQKTTIAGGSYSGTVKEFINISDYRIRIYGVVANPKQTQYPFEQLQILKDLWKRNEAVTFESDISDGLFEYVVIESIKFDELKMSPGLQFYEIQAVSDGVQEVELLMNE